MGHASRLWQLWMHAPNPRSEREIQGDIDDELAFHIEERTRELAASGLASSAARARALERFGNIDKVRAECRRVQMGDRIMLHRSILVTLVVLLAGVVALGFQNVVSQRAANAEMDALRREISSLAHAVTEQRASPAPATTFGALHSLYVQPQMVVPPAAPKLTEEETSREVWVQRLRVAAETAPAEPDEDLLTKEVTRLRDRSSLARVAQLLPEIWPQVPVEARRALLEAMASGRSESRARSAIRLGATDADAELSRRALELLREITFVDLADAEAYRLWEKETLGKPAALLLRESVPAVMQKLLAAPAWTDASERWGMLEPRERLETADLLEELLRDHGAARLIQAWASDPSPRARIAAVRWIRLAKLDEVTARMLLMPILQDKAARDLALVSALCETMESFDSSWTWEPLLEELARGMRTFPRDYTLVAPVADVLAQMNPESVVPTLIAWIRKEQSPQVDQTLGRALETMTGVELDPMHDANWWTNWWLIHHHDYPSAPGKEADLGLPVVR